MDRVAATMPLQAHAGAAQEAPDIGQWEGQDVPLVRPSSCNVKRGIPSSRRYLPTYLHNTCNPDTTLAPETPEWRWLADVTPKYVLRRAMTLWMKKHRQEDKDGVRSYPWETKCLSAGEFLEWKVCV